MRGNCGSCLHWIELPGQPGNMRFCTCNPPTVILVPRQSHLNPGQMNLSAEGAWPPVMAEHSCGKWEKSDEIRETIKTPEGDKIISIDRDRK